MIDSYFFIPGDKERYINKIGEIDSEYFVIDLEESVSGNNKMKALNNVIKLNVKKNIFIRIPFKDNVFDEKQLKFLINKFEGRIVLPKVTCQGDLERFFSMINGSFKYEIIILVENPMCFINLQGILSQHLGNIYAIGFGSHDFCSAMNMKHNDTHLNYYKKQLILLAKAFQVSFIDGVDLNIRELTNFEAECIYAFDAGVDGKFLIHPIQLQKLREIQYLSKEEIEIMADLLKKRSQISEDDLDLFEIGGKIYEKPHIKRMERLIRRVNISKSNLGST